MDQEPPLSNYYQKFLDHGVYTHKKEGKWRHGSPNFNTRTSGRRKEEDKEEERGGKVLQLPLCVTAVARRQVCSEGDSLSLSAAEKGKGTSSKTCYPSIYRLHSGQAEQLAHPWTKEREEMMAAAAVAMETLGFTYYLETYKITKSVNEDDGGFPKWQGDGKTLAGIPVLANGAAVLTGHVFGRYIHQRCHGDAPSSPFVFVVDFVEREIERKKKSKKGWWTRSAGRRVLPLTWENGGFYPPPPPSGLVYNIRPVRLFPPFSFCEREEETIAAGRTRKREPREILYNKRERERERHVTYDKSDVGWCFHRLRAAPTDQ